MKHYIFQIRNKTLPVTCLYLLHFRPIMALEIKILQFLINTGKTRTQYSLYPVQLLPFLYFLIRHRRIRTCIRQQTLRKNKQINNTGNGYKDSYLSKFKHREAFEPGIQYHTMHHQISRGTDQRTNTTQNSDIRKRYQEFCSRKLHRIGPMLDYRSKDNHDRSIIQESGDERHRR